LKLPLHNLEDPVVEARLAEPRTLLSGMKGLVVIDEVQRAPELFKTLRVLLDRPDNPVRFLLLGSASPALLKQSSESLAGRIELIEMAGFTLDEVGPGEQPCWPIFTGRCGMRPSRRGLSA
jgi:predicted AAA+ superfamily ATPase